DQHPAPLEVAAGLRWQVPDGGDDVDPADADAGQSDGQEADQEPAREPVDQAGRGDGVDEVEPAVLGGEAGEDAGRDLDPGPADAEPGDQAERGGDQGVDGALDDETADQPPAPHAHRPQHAQLGLALLGQHHEHVHQQHDAGDDGEAADEQEQGADLAADGLGLLENLLLGRLDRGAGGGQVPEGGLQLVLDLVGGGGPALDAAGVGDQGEGLGAGAAADRPGGPAQRRRVHEGAAAGEAGQAAGRDDPGHLELD